MKVAERSTGTELFPIRHGVMVLHRIQAQDSAATLATSFRVARSYTPAHINLYGKNLGSHYLTLVAVYDRTFFYRSLAISSNSSHIACPSWNMQAHLARATALPGYCNGSAPNA